MHLHQCLALKKTLPGLKVVHKSLAKAELLAVGWCLQEKHQFPLTDTERMRNIPPLHTETPQDWRPVRKDFTSSSGDHHGKHGV